MGYSGVVHDVYFHGVEILFMQRDVQDKIEDLVHDSVQPHRLVDNTKKWRLRVFDDHVFQQIAVNVHVVNAVQRQ